MTKHKRSTDRQLDIIKAATRIIDLQGIHALTLKNIAGELGLSDAALLRHFQDKEEIVEAMAQKVFFHTVVPEEYPSDTSVAENLALLMKGQFQAFSDWPEASSILFHEEIFKEYPAVLNWLQERRMGRQRRIVEYLKHCQQRGEISMKVDLDSFTLIFMGTMTIAVREWRESGRSYDLTERAERLVHTMTQGLESD